MAKSSDQYWDSTLDRLREIIGGALAAEEIIAAATIARRHHASALELAMGDGVTVDSVFLIASITKPIVCTGAALLVERGELDLDDPVCMFVPEFAQNGKQHVLLRHLFTHTSGLPDILPNNEALRRSQSPLSEFVDSVCREPLMFRPGTSVSYQSMGILMLAEIVERITAKPLRDFLRSELFEPLGMNSTSLGWSNDLADRVVEATPSPDSDGAWVWNSPYWRHLGAPWGGAFSTAGDIARFLEMFLDDGEFGSTRIIQPITAKSMIADLTVGVPGSDRNERPENGWGLGWQIQRRGGGGFGSFTPPGAFGHYGVTGTLAWADPRSESVFAMLTSGKMPETHRTLKRCSNVIAAAVSGALTS